MKISFFFSFITHYVQYIVRTKCSLSFHYYVSYAVIKRKDVIFLVNNNNVIWTIFTQKDYEVLDIFISLLRSLQRDYDKKYCFRFTITWTRLWEWENFFHFATAFTTAWSRENTFFILVVCLLRHDLEKKGFFSFQR